MIQLSTNTLPLSELLFLMVTGDAGLIVLIIVTGVPRIEGFSELLQNR